jgi:hypothetical protein
MIFRALSSSGDWLFGSGKDSYAKFNNAIILSIETSLRTFLGECFFAPDVGQPWFDIIDYKNKDLIVLTIKSAITQLYGVIGVNELEYTYDLNRVLTIKYDINTMYTKNLLGTVTI